MEPCRYSFLREGYEVDQIAEIRRIKSGTVYSHLAQLYREGYEVELKPYLPTEVQYRVREAIQAIGRSGFQLLGRLVPRAAFHPRAPNSLVLVVPPMLRKCRHKTGRQTGGQPPWPSQH